MNEFSISPLFYTFRLLRSDWPAHTEATDHQSGFLKGTPTNLEILPYFVVFELYLSSFANQSFVSRFWLANERSKVPRGRRHLEFLMTDDVNSWSVAEVNKTNDREQA